ncbi:MAG TPA: HEAT repeat domain-containing protein [Anaeromyxobacteraceae bacterium]|nr:HEAT repeat domain-containing protein [Anaeromyxobacteraceae bacterium]
MGSGEPGRAQGRAPPLVRLLRPLLYGLLLASAVLTLTGVPALEAAVREGRASPLVLVLAPALLGVFILLFAVYRFALVRAGRYHGGKALVQVGFLFAALALLLPGSMERYRAAGAVRPVDLTRQLASGDAEARAMAAELARHRAPEDALRYVPRLVELVTDPSPEVRRQARASLVALAGQDAGGEGPDAAARWREWWRARGVAFPSR